MNIFMIYLGIIYLFLGLIYIIVPLIYLEVGRPKDLIIGGLNLLIGIILIIKNKVLTNLFLAIFILVTIIVFLYVLEIFSSRWNQLTEKEKLNFSSLASFKNNLSKILDAFYLGIGNFKNPFKLLKFEEKNKNLTKKKWVRNDKSDKIKS